MEKLKVNFEVKEDDDILAQMKKEYHECAAAVKYCISRFLQKKI